MPLVPTNPPRLNDIREEVDESVDNFPGVAAPGVFDLSAEPMDIYLGQLQETAEVDAAEAAGLV